MSVIQASDRADQGGGLAEPPGRHPGLSTADSASSDPLVLDIALQDALTGLGNRRHLTQSIDTALQGSRSPGAVALLMIDLDRFKNVNDSLGHPAGDALLCIVAHRLRQSIRVTELCFRLGGDEFAVLLRDGGEAEALASRLVDVLSRPYLIDGQIAIIGASIGVARTTAATQTQVGLVRHADLALYSAKGAGRQRWHEFEPAMAQRAEARRDLELDLRKALKLSEFKLVYQAQLDFNTGVPTGFEALLRWHHPARGIVSPVDFIPIAEETGLIVDIGEWVLRTACVEAMNWPGSPRVAVNVSPMQFGDGRRLAVAVKQALTVSALPPNRLEVEITESSLLRSDQGVLETLHRLRELGVRIAMDDFGTGYSSLSQLVTFPFDKIKIDQSFVRGAAASAGGGAIVRAIAALGHSLGMATIAEGVETQEQATRVRSDGCTAMQGYLVSRPIPGAQVVEMLRDIIETARLECDGQP